MRGYRTEISIAFNVICAVGAWKLGLIDQTVAWVFISSQLPGFFAAKRASRLAEPNQLLKT